MTQKKYKLKSTFFYACKIKKNLDLKINLSFKNVPSIDKTTIILFTIVEKSFSKKLAYLDITFFLHNANTTKT
jgi:hypothetical protein